MKSSLVMNGNVLLVNFLCFLSNANSNLKEIKLDLGFRIESPPLVKAMGLVDLIERNVPPHSRKGKKLDGVAGDLIDDQGNATIVLNQLEADLKFDENGHLLRIPNEIIEFQKDIENGYLSDQLAKIRLFKEGNVAPIVSFYYAMGEDGPNLITVCGRGDLPSIRTQYDLKVEEVGKLQAFIDELELPFEFPYLQLAYDLYEYSYEIASTKLTFLTLMNGLEVLFSPASTETSYSVSRNAAVLLGAPDEESEEVFKSMMDLYRKRSTLIYGQHEIKKKSRKVDLQDIVYLRSLLRRGIIGAYHLGLEKEKFLSLLNRSKM
jgi:hypothetical protein